MGGRRGKMVVQREESRWLHPGADPLNLRRLARLKLELSGLMEVLSGHSNSSGRLSSRLPGQGSAPQDAGVLRLGALRPAPALPPAARPPARAAPRPGPARPGP